MYMTLISDNVKVNGYVDYIANNIYAHIVMTMTCLVNACVFNMYICLLGI